MKYPFVHLHVHSQYSILDGQASIQALVDKAQADGQPGMALTDHGNMFGIKEFYNYVKKKNGIVKESIGGLKKKIAAIEAEIKAAEESQNDAAPEAVADAAAPADAAEDNRPAPFDKAAKEAEKERLREEIAALEQKIFKPILGCEMYVARRSMESRGDKIDAGGWHLIVLAKNQKGYHNLVKLVSNAWTRGYYYHPRTDKTELEKYHEGLIICSACLGGEVPQKLMRESVEAAEEAVKTYREETGAIDQDLPAFVIAENGEPAGRILDGDSVIFFNFRGDRAIEISRAFDDKDFDKFDRKPVNVVYAGMLEYDGDAHIPSRFLVNPPEITDTMGEYLALAGVKQLALSETQKYGHVTYFWNGNRSGKFSEELEDYVEIPSDVVPFEQRPWMQCALITDELIKRIESGEYTYLRVNFPNGDMVGHTGDLNATIVSMEALDLCLARILKAVDAVHGIAIITADHGNADEMLETDKKTGKVKNKAKTSHTLNKVPCICYDNFHADTYEVLNGSFGLANHAATVLDLLGWSAPEKWENSMIKLK